MSIATQDLAAPFDPTAYSSISGAQLLQLVNGLAPFTGVGMIIATTDVGGVPQIPDAVAEPKWASYIWLRISPASTSVAVYVWNANQPYNLPYNTTTVTTNWNPIVDAAIPANSIQGFQIAQNTITADRIISITASQITGFSPGNFVGKTDSPAAGYISGNFTTGLIINNGSITTAMFTALAVDTASIAAKAVTPAKILGGTQGQILETTNGTTDAGWVTPNDLVAQASAAVQVAGNGSKVLRVNSGATAYELVANTNIGSVVQVLVKTGATPDSTATTIPADNTIPQITEGKEYVTQDIMPTSAANLIHVQFTCFAAIGSAGSISIALFQDAVANALAATSVTPAGTGNNPASLTIDFWIRAASTTARTYRIRFGPSAGTGYMNQTSTNTLFGASAISFLRIEEVVGALS